MVQRVNKTRRYKRNIARSCEQPSCSFFCLLCATAAAAQSAVSGVVRDEAGGAVSGASIIVLGTGGPEQQTVTGPMAASTLSGAPGGSLTMVVRAGGFAEWTAVGSAPSTRSSVVLKIATSVRIGHRDADSQRAAARRRSRPAPTSSRRKPSGSRRPSLPTTCCGRCPPSACSAARSSLSSHPTAQGVSLRGIGPSGVSRTLVLVDGVPFNDPFGGWVYWTRVPLESVDRIELIDGSSSSLYGNYAHGRRHQHRHATRARRRTVEFKTQYGNHNSPKADFFASDVWGKFGVSRRGQLLRHRRLPDRDRRRARAHRQQRRRSSSRTSTSRSTTSADRSA